jgi:hypothetical protein
MSADHTEGNEDAEGSVEQRTFSVLILLRVFCGLLFAAYCVPGGGPLGMAAGEEGRVERLGATPADPPMTLM